MSNDGEAGKTEEEIIAMYEEMFKDRYTDSDPDFVETMKKPLNPPPCVQNWYYKRKRGGFHDDYGGRSGRGGGHRGRGNWSRGGGGFGGGGPPRFGYYDNRQRDSYGPRHPPPHPPPHRPFYGGYRGRGDWQGPPPLGPRWGRGGPHGSRYQPY